MVIAIIRFFKFVPSAATTARDMRIGGTQINTSMMRQMVLSITPPKYPALAPSTAPITSAIKLVDTPMKREYLEP